MRPGCGSDDWKHRIGRGNLAMGEQADDTLVSWDGLGGVSVPVRGHNRERGCRQDEKSQPGSQDRLTARWSKPFQAPSVKQSLVSASSVFPKASASCTSGRILYSSITSAVRAQESSVLARLSLALKRYPPAVRGFRGRLWLPRPIGFTPRRSLRKYWVGEMVSRPTNH